MARWQVVEDGGDIRIALVTAAGVRISEPKRRYGTKQAAKDASKQANEGRRSGPSRPGSDSIQKI